MNKDELVEKVTHIIAMGRAAEINSTHIAEDVIRALVLDGTNKLIPGWRNISEATDDTFGLFWLEFGEGAEHLNPPLGKSKWAENQIFWGKNRTWSSIYKATHFIPLSSIPTPEDTDG